MVQLSVALAILAVTLCTSVVTYLLVEAPMRSVYCYLVDNCLYEDKSLVANYNSNITLNSNDSNNNHLQYSLGTKPMPISTCSQFVNPNFITSPQYNMYNSNQSSLSSSVVNITSAGEQQQQ